MRELTRKGLELQRSFLNKNGINIPRLVINKFNTSNISGYFSPDAMSIFIFENECAHPSKRYSFPGLYCDRTPFGVIQHETGHYIDYLIDKFRFSYKLRRQSNEAALTSYCKNSGEWFAEMFRLFITNPNLLKMLRPNTYNILSSYFKLSTNKNWKEVLIDNGANNFIIKRTQNKIDRS